MDSPALTGIVEKLSNLHTLYLFGEDDNDSQACFTTETQPALFKLTRCAAITTIDMVEINGWPITFLQHCAHLKRLRIYAFRNTFVNDVAAEEQEKFHIETWFTLEELKLKTFPSPTVFSFIGISHPALRTLAFTSDMTEKTAHFSRMKQSCTHSLVPIDTGMGIDNVFTTDASKGLTNLRRVTVKGGNIEACRSLIAVLRNAAGMRPVGEISIRLDFVDEFSPSSDVV